MVLRNLQRNPVSYLIARFRAKIKFRAMSRQPWEAGCAVDARLDKRVDILATAHDALVKTWTQEERDQCYLNRLALKWVVDSYFVDLDRKKEFHEINFADAHKRAGYTVKWIIKYRPIQPTQEKCSIKAILANELFAFSVALKLLNISPDRIPENLCRHVLYALRFRPVEGNAWALAFFLMQEAYKDPIISEEHR